MLRGSEAQVFLDCQLGHAAAKQVYQPSCPRAVTSVPRIAVNGCHYAALSSSSRCMQPAQTKLVNWCTNGLKRVRLFVEVLGCVEKMGTKVKTASQYRHPAGGRTDELKRAKRGAKVSTESNASTCEKKKQPASRLM